MNPRLKNLSVQLNKHKIDAFLVTKDINVTYLTHFPTAESWLLTTPQKSFFITDFRYALEAKKGLKGTRVESYPKSIYDTTVKLGLAEKVKKIGYDPRHLSVQAFMKLQKASRGHLRWVAMAHIVENLRSIKTQDEISQIRKAISLNLKTFLYIKNHIKPGVTERKLYHLLERFIKDHNAALSFDSIVASGPNSCFPHAKVTDRKIQKNDMVLIDTGIDIGGYKSDLTRMFFLGKIPTLALKIYEYIKSAQRRAVNKVKPGIPAKDIDYQARKYLEENKLAKYFGHSLGHGVGLEVHESPAISSSSQVTLQEGMVFTVEPGVYIPNQFGIRTEDMVLVTKQGYEVLSGHCD